RPRPMPPRRIRSKAGAEFDNIDVVRGKSGNILTHAKPRRRRKAAAGKGHDTNRPDVGTTLTVSSQLLAREPDQTAISFTRGGPTYINPIRANVAAGDLAQRRESRERKYARISGRCSASLPCQSLIHSSTCEKKYCARYTRSFFRNGNSPVFNNSRLTLCMV